MKISLITALLTIGLLPTANTQEVKSSLASKYSRFKDYLKSNEGQGVLSANTFAAQTRQDAFGNIFILNGLGKTISTVSGTKRFSTTSITQSFRGFKFTFQDHPGGIPDGFGIFVENPGGGTYGSAEFFDEDQGRFLTRAEMDGIINQNIPSGFIEGVAADPDSNAEVAASETVFNEKKTVQQRKKKIKKYKFDIEPAIFFDFDIKKEVVKLGEHKVVEAKDLNTNVIRSSMLNDTLQINNDAPKDGYYVKTQVSIAGGFGASFVVSFLDTSSKLLKNLKPHVSIIPMIGAEHTTERFVENLADASFLDFKKFPKNIEDLKDWKNGESLSLKTYGGVLATIGVSFYGLGVSLAGQPAVLTGNFVTSFKKISESQVIVNQTCIKPNSFLTNVSYSVGLPVLSAGVVNIDVVNKSVSFLVDLSDEKSAKAYSEFVGGNATELEKLADDKSNQFVARSETSEVIQTGNIYPVTIGIPFWNATWAKGEMNTKGYKIVHSTDLKHEVNIGAIVDSFAYRFIFDHEDKNVVFSAGHAKSSESEEYFGKFSYVFKDESASPSKLKYAIDRVVEITGVQGLKTNVPTEEDDLGFVSLNADFNISTEATDSLMDEATEKGAEIKRKMKAALDKTITIDYVFHKRDVKKYKQVKNRGHRGKSHRSLTRNVRLSSSEMIKQERMAAFAAIDQMFDALIAMKAVKNRIIPTSIEFEEKIRPSKNVDFIESYLDLGRALVKNPYAFQAFIKYAQKHGATLDYKITGEKINLMSKTYQKASK